MRRWATRPAAAAPTLPLCCRAHLASLSSSRSAKRHLHAAAGRRRAARACFSTLSPFRNASGSFNPRTAGSMVAPEKPRADALGAAGPLLQPGGDGQGWRAGVGQAAHGQPAAAAGALCGEAQAGQGASAALSQVQAYISVTETEIGSMPLHPVLHMRAVLIGQVQAIRCSGCRSSSIVHSHQTTGAVCLHLCCGGGGA